MDEERVLGLGLGDDPTHFDKLQGLMVVPELFGNVPQNSHNKAGGLRGPSQEDT